MVYAIVQKELIVPDVEQLKRAFSVSPLLTELDAQTVFNDAYGILLRGQDAEQARLLQEALRREQIETELVEEANLPTIPSAHVVRQLEFHPDQLVLHDPMRRTSQCPWNDLMFIAAGYVTIRPGIGQDLRSAAASREADHAHAYLTLELFLHNGARYSIWADEFDFDCLGDLLSDDRGLNFVTLIRSLANEAPNAGQNRGAYHACLEPPELFPYPNKAAFNEELIWMLWRIGQLKETPPPDP